jgi:hypothetical protein
MTNRRGHKIFTYWEPWMNAFRAYSDSLGADDSPYGEGKTEAEAIADLDWQLEELEDKAKEKRRDA